MHVEPFLDPVRDYDARSGRTSWSSMEAVAACIDRRKLAIPYAIDTHAHADHLSGLPFFRERYGARSVTGARVGTARCDFPGGSAAILYDSIQRLYALPDPTRLFVCHDYQPGGRALAYVSTVDEQKRKNLHLRFDTAKAEFVALRERRDAGLETPALLLPALQVDIRAGRLPEPETNGISYSKIPLDASGRR